MSDKPSKPAKPAKSPKHTKSRSEMTPRERQRQQFAKDQRARYANNQAKKQGGTHQDDSDRNQAAGPPGYPVRALAVRLVSGVVDRRRSLDEALSHEFATGDGATLEPRDKALARLIATTVLRRRGELDAVVAKFIENPLPADRGLLTHILHCAAAQLLVLEIAPHAVINIAVEQCRHDRGARRFDKLANAVLRRVSERGRDILAQLRPGARTNVPGWMWNRWSAAYSDSTATSIAEACLREAPLDLSIKNPSEIALWAERLGGVALPGGTVRVADPEARVDALPGFAEGAWWVQDAAAALPARLLGDISGQHVADLCTAPGGKAAQLAASGAHVTAVDVSANRLVRVRENLARLQLEADVVTADITTWQPNRTFDAILLDAPCTATGTIRRHPDILHLKRERDLTPLVELQSRMLDAAASLLRPGGTLVYCTCSLEPEEGEHQIDAFLARHPSFARAPLSAADGLAPEWITPSGDLRTLPQHNPSPDLTSGMDGFFAARVRC